MGARRVKVRTQYGCLYDQEIFTIADNKKNLSTAKPQERFKTEEERLRHKWNISRRHHMRLFNANVTPDWLYSTLTMDNDHEVHTFEDARRVRNRYYKRLKRAFPQAKIFIYMGRGKSTNRIHFHMVSFGVPAEVISKKWIEGKIVRVEPVRRNNYYNGIDCGQDYTGLANYLFDHWTPEQGSGHKYQNSTNMVQPMRDKPTEIVRNYTKSSPPRAPKGYRLVGYEDNRFGYMRFTYIKDEPKGRKRRI